MAQLQGVFTDEQTAHRAVEKLRAMDIPDNDIMLTREGKGADARFQLTAQVPDGQFSAAQAVVNTAANAGGAAPPAAGEPGVPPAPAGTDRADFTEEAGGGAVGAVAGGLAGAAVAGPIGAVGGAALGAAGGAAAVDAATEPDSDDETVVYSGRGGTGTDNDVLGTPMGADSTANPDVGAQVGPGVVGTGALGGPGALTARAAAMGSERELIEEDLERKDPDSDGDTINSVSPR